MRIVTHTAILGSLAASLNVSYVEGGELARCLYGMNVGDKHVQVVACPDSDPLGLGTNPDVRRAMDALGIAPNRVRFKGCEGQLYSVYPDAPGSKYAYVVTYPSERTTFLAPVLHELAHVMQMEYAGGLSQLMSKYKLSKRVELEADYFVGTLFAKYFPDKPLRLFEQDLKLKGLYYESEEMKHGTPEERVTAFRFGAMKLPSKVGNDFRRISAEFQRDVYGEVVALSK